MEDLLPPGAAPGTVPTDLEQSTGLERLELLGKMQGIDIFDMKPLDASRRGRLMFNFSFLPRVPANEGHMKQEHGFGSDTTMPMRLEYTRDLPENG